jgi:hypothetical protein
MPATRTYPKIQNEVFDTPDTGISPILDPSPVPRGCLDVWTTTGTAGSSRCLVALLQTAIPAVVLIGLDTTNRPIALLNDATGAVAVVSVPAGAAIATGVRMHLRLSWDAVNAISGLNHVVLTRDGEVLAALGTTTWTPFIANMLHVGRQVNATYLSINGSIEVAQVGNLPTIP